MGLLRFAIKSSIAGGALYYTVEEGLWSSPEEALQFYNKLYNNIRPVIQQNVPKEVIEEINHLPKPSDLKGFVAGYWNKGVSASVNFLYQLPEHVSSGVEWVQQEIEKSSLATDSQKIVDSK